jgi:hypothetical protein
MPNSVVGTVYEKPWMHLLGSKMIENGNYLFVLILWAFVGLFTCVSMLMENDDFVITMLLINALAALGTFIMVGFIIFT